MASVRIWISLVILCMGLKVPHSKAMAEESVRTFDPGPDTAPSPSSVGTTTDASTSTTVTVASSTSSAPAVSSTQTGETTSTTTSPESTAKSSTITGISSGTITSTSSLFGSTTSNSAVKTTTGLCGLPKVDAGKADTSNPEVTISWPVNGCGAAANTTDIQITSGDRPVCQVNQLADCSNIVHSFQVAYESEAHDCVLSPLEDYVAKVESFCENQPCECRDQSGTDVNFKTPPRAITKDENADLSLDVSASRCSTNAKDGMVLVELNSTTFTNPGAPGIRGYHIVIGFGDHFDPDWFNTTISFKEAQSSGFKSAFYLTNSSNPFNPFQNSKEARGCCRVTQDGQSTCADGHGYSSTAEILIGADSCDSKDEHCIGSLKGKAFWIGILALPNTSVCTKSVYCGELEKSIFINASLTAIEIGTSGPNVGAIVGGVIGGLALVAVLVAAGLVVYFRYYRKSPQILPVMPNTPPSMIHTQTGRSRYAGKSYDLQFLPKPIDLYRFEEILPDLLRDSAFSLLKEFSHLCEQSPSIKERHTVGCKEENLPKNRYVDIVPFDESRVRLEGDRYINASWIRGFNHVKEYIAAQGPMGENDRKTRGKHSTIDDFFEIIWQHNVTCIVMLTQLMEAGRPKCAQYWPREVGGVEQHGVFTVLLRGETDCGSYMTREMELRKSGNTPRIVVQYHYKRWPDMTVTDELELLDFVRLVRSFVHSTRMTTPLLTHCSAGVGRSGVFISLDILLQQLRERTYVDIAATVFALRQQRVRMVQTDEQYVMLYSAMGVAIKQRLGGTMSSDVSDDEASDQTASQQVTYDV